MININIYDAFKYLGIYIYLDCFLFNVIWNIFFLVIFNTNKYLLLYKLI